jgi:hypothetical protein
MLRALAALATAMLILLTAAEAAAPPARAKADPFPSPEAIQVWMKGYRSKPAPRLLPAAVKAMSRHGVFRDIDSAGLYLGFVAGVISANPKTAERLLGDMFPLPPEDQVVVVRAVAWSGLADWRPLLSRLAERMPAKAVLIDRHLSGKLPDLLELPLDENPAAIDALWGHYYGSGSVMPIRRLVSALGWSADTKDVDKLTAGSMIKLTLAVNATRDVELLAILKREAINQGKATARPLAEVIEAAETYETAKLRRTALASIEELKTKGSSTKRNVSFWGQVGTTALALGCVAASVMGQIQLGVPCVVGGAGASAALKMFTLER